METGGIAKIMAKKLLLAEDTSQSFEKFKKVLQKNQWQVSSTTDGEEALELLQQSSYDVMVTDLNLRTLNGMSLISRVQLDLPYKPIIIAITDHDFPEVRKRAFEHKVFAYLPKPLDKKKFVECLYRALNSEHLVDPELMQMQPAQEEYKPPFVGVFLAVGTGGPQTLKKLFMDWTPPEHCAVFIVQHGPEWALESLPERFVNSFNVPATLARDGMQPKPGKVYIAPGKHHLKFDFPQFKFKLSDGLPENFMRPAADPFFRSAAECFGPFGVGVVLSGSGKDGSEGARVLEEYGGTVLIQDPKTAIAPLMPQAAVETLRKPKKVAIEEMGQRIVESVQPLAGKLQ